MLESATVLKNRVLLCFLSGDEKEKNVTGIAKTLGEEKYTISRIMKELEEEGLVDRTKPRRPVLTPDGSRLAKYYSENIDVSVDLLLHSGVEPVTAKRDGLYWGIFNSKETSRVVKNLWNVNHIKRVFQGKSNFNGTELCRDWDDGTYKLPFVLYSEIAKNGKNFSMANSAFVNPCIITVKNGKGFVHIEAIPVEVGIIGPRQVDHIKYSYEGVFETAEKSGRIFTFPIDSLDFSSFGTGNSQIIHGQTEMEFFFRLSENHKQGVRALFTIII